MQELRCYTRFTQAINGSRNIPSQSVSKLLDYPSSVCSGEGDPDQGQLSWDHQDPSDKNPDCNEWKHWNGSAVVCGRRGHVMLEWLVEEMVRTNLFSGRHDPSLSLWSQADLNPSLLPSSAATGPNPVPIHCNINCKLYNSKNWKFAAYCCDPTKQPCFPVFDWYAVMWYLDMLELLALLNEFISAHIPAEVYHEMDCGYWLMQ